MRKFCLQNRNLCPAFVLILINRWGVKRRFYGWITMKYLLFHQVKLNPKKCRFNGRTYLILGQGCNASIGDGFIANSGIMAGIDAKMAVR